MNDSIESFTSPEFHSSQDRIIKKKSASSSTTERIANSITESTKLGGKRLRTEHVDTQVSSKAKKKAEKAEATALVHEKKNAEKNIAKKSRVDERHVRGGYANEELGIEMSPELFDSEIGKAINIAVRDANRGRVVLDPLQHTLANLILWKRGNFNPADAISSKKLVDDEGEIDFVNARTEKHACIVMRGSKFAAFVALHLKAIRSNDPKGGHIAHIRGMQKMLLEGSKLYITVISLQDAIADLFAKKGVNLTMIDAENASIQLYIATNVEITFCNSATEVGEFVERLSREVAERPYKMLPEALACVTKESLSSSAKDELGISDKKDPTYILWAMLQSLPGLAAKKATAVVKSYPTIKSLVDAYENPDLTLSQKEKLLESILGTAVGKSTILSKQVYIWITSMRPEESV
jgi:hypothetical protein